MLERIYSVFDYLTPAEFENQLVVATQALSISQGLLLSNISTAVHCFPHHITLPISWLMKRAFCIRHC